jgi:hypothetical protein
MIEVQYTGGYAAGSIPPDIQEAVALKAVCEFAQSSAYQNPAFKQQNIGGAAQTRIDEGDVRRWMRVVEELLAPYKRWEV